MLPNRTGNSNDKINFAHKLSLTYIENLIFFVRLLQIICKISRIIQLAGFLGRVLRLLMRVGLSLIKNKKLKSSPHKTVQKKSVCVYELCINVPLTSPH